MAQQETAKERMEVNIEKLEALMNALQYELDDAKRLVSAGMANWNDVGTIAHTVQVLDEVVNPEMH